MSEFITVEEANKLLLDRCGKNVGGKPFYRIAMCDQMEALVDHMGRAQINRKYETEDPRCYVLEFLADASRNPEIPNDYSYEPLWVFHGPNGEPLPLIWKAIEFILGVLESGTKKTIEDYRKEEEKRRADFKDFAIGIFENAACESDNPDLITGETVAGFRSKEEK